MRMTDIIYDNKDGNKLCRQRIQEREKLLIEWLKTYLCIMFACTLLCPNMYILSGLPTVRQQTFSVVELSFPWFYTFQDFTFILKGSLQKCKIWVSLYFHRKEIKKLQTIKKYLERLILYHAHSFLIIVRKGNNSDSNSNFHSYPFINISQT
jgi:hypothetical protein